MNQQEEILLYLKTLAKGRVTPEQLVQAVGLLTQSVTTSIQNGQAISDDLKNYVDRISTEIKGKAINLKGELASIADAQVIASETKLLNKIEALKKTINTLELKHGKDGKDGKDADSKQIIKDVLKEISIPKLTGEMVLDAIDSLPIESDYQIDAKHIKNLPQMVQQATMVAGNRFLEQLVDVNTTGLSRDAYGRFILGSGGGITDGDYGDITVSGGGTVWTIDNLAVTNAKINSVAWAKITGTPTTLSGYGITDAQAQLNGTGFVKISGTTISYDNSTYLTTASASATYQPLDSDLTTIAGLTATTDNFLQAKGSAWASRTVAQVKTDLGLTGTNSGDQNIFASIIVSGQTTVTTASTSQALTLVAGTNVTITTDNTTKTITINASGGGGSMAIGGSITSATLGSVLYAGTAGVLAQDNANFFYDATNVRLGVGTSSPLGKIDLLGSGYVNAYIRTSASNTGANFIFKSPISEWATGLRDDISAGTYAIVDNSLLAIRLTIDALGAVKIYSLSTGLVKSTSGVLSNATDGTDYLSPTTGITVSQASGQTIGSTGSRLTKLWATDITVTNAITGSVTGNAGTATALQNARTIGGVSFDGTANITVASATGGFTITGGALTLTDQNMVLSATTGTKFGTATTQKLSFYNSTPIVQPTGDVITALQNLGLIASATILATTITSRNLWGQAYNGSADVTGSLTSVGNITGGASSMTITAGTGNSRTLTLQTTTSGGVATTAIVIDATQGTTFSGDITVSTKNIITDTTTGTKIGTATTQKIGFFNATPVVQQTGSVVTALANLGLVTSATFPIASVSGLGTGVATALAVNTGSAGAFVLFNGALGTPTSGTLTNATGLPVSGITASTVTALGVGSIELGNASDTTIARVSAGVVSIEGVTIDTASNTLALTNKTLTSSTNVLGGVTMTLGSDASGDVYYRNSSGVLTRVSAGAQGTVFTMGASNIPAWTTPSGGVSASVQDIPVLAGSVATNGGSGYYICTNPTGTVMFIAVDIGGSGNCDLYRFAKDSTTGAWYKTHNTSFSTSTSNGVRGICANNAFVYVTASISAVLSLKRFSLTDLSGITSMTFSGTSRASNCFGDTAGNIYIQNGSTDQYDKFTISGTTATNAGAVTFTSSSTSSGGISDGTNVWIYDGSTTIRKYAIAGGSATASFAFVNASGVYKNATTTQLIMATSSSIGITWAYNNSDASALIGALLHTFAVTV